MSTSLDRSSKLRPFLPRLTIAWIGEEPDVRAKALDGTVVFVDISGFTKMSERLARLGRVGAEEVTDVVGFVFRQLLSTAYANGGGLIKFGGDALLLLFSGENHPSDGVAAAIGMRRALAEMGQIDTSAGKVRLNMSIGVHSGTFHLFLPGRSHRELLMTGPGASTVVDMEGSASAGEIMVSMATAERIPPEMLSRARGDGFLLRRSLRPGSGTAGYEPEPQPVPPSVDLAEGIPVALRDMVLSGHVEPEHRRVTIGFVHFDGLDELVATCPLDDVAAALDQLVTAAQDACAANGVTFLGTDVDHDGGKIILVAGAPTASGDDEARMLAALRQLQGSDLRIPIRSGVNTGPVFAGDIGPSYRRTYTVMGDAVNLAARVMAKAEPGQVLAAQSVLDACSLTFETTELEPFMVKGKTFPVYASVIGEPRGAKSAAEDSELPLVGRDFETAILQRAVRSALSGEGSLLEVVGPPGIGKTRLLGELVSAAVEMRQLATACDLYGASTPYAAVRPLLLQALDLPVDAERETIVSRLMQVVWNSAPELSVWLPLLGVPLDLDLPSNPEVDQLEPEFVRPRLHETLAELLLKVLHEPVLIAVEDSHWMDEASSDLFRRLSREVDDRPWLICITRRDEETGFAAPTSAATVSLRPASLSEEQIVELLIAATDDAPLRPHEMSILARRSGGNPLFLQELLNATRAAGGTEGLPDTVEAMVTSQIDRLSADDRRVLRHASVLGIRFRAALVEELLEGAAPSGAAVWRRLGDFVASDGDGMYRFRHALMRDAAYEGLSYRRRRQLHARAGEVIERERTSPDQHLDLLALHFFHAHSYDKAWEYARGAARAAKAKFAIVDATEHLERALQSARQVSSVDPPTIAAVYEELGDLRERIGQYPQAAGAFGSARASLDSDSPSLGRLYYKQATVAERDGNYSQALRWLGRGMRQLESIVGGAEAQEYARLLAFYGVIRHVQGRRRDAETWLRRAIEAAQRSNEQEALAHAYFILDWVLVEMGRSDEAVYSPLALEIYQRLGILGPAAGVYNNLGMFAWLEGRWDQALELYEQASELRRRIGDDVDAAMYMHNTAEVLSDQGHLEEARPMFEETLRVCRAADYRIGVAYATSSLGREASRSRDFTRAAELYAGARDMFEHGAGEYELIDTDARIAEAHVMQGRCDEAIELATACLQSTAAAGGAIQDPLLYRVRGYASLQRGDIDAAFADFDASVRSARERNARYEVALTLDAIARAAELCGQQRPDARSEADELFASLGVVSLPMVPLKRERPALT